MKLKELYALNEYVYGAFVESSGLSRTQYDALDLEIPEGHEDQAAAANDEVNNTHMVTPAWELGAYDTADICRCPLAYTFSELFF